MIYKEGDYKDLSSNHKHIIGYEFDRLQFEDKCKLMYGYLRGSEFEAEVFDTKGFEFDDNLHEILHPFIIYKSKDRDNYYFNDELEDTTNVDIFGFVFAYNDKPCFYKYNENKISPPTQIDLEYINESLKRYSSTAVFNKFKKTPDKKIWGYTVMRGKGKKKACVFKFVQGGVKGTNYPPGPGNVCMADNPESKLNSIRSYINKTDSNLGAIVEGIKKYKKQKTHKNIKRFSEKKHLCFLLEITLRIKNLFYPYDKVWLKYYEHVDDENYNA